MKPKDIIKLLKDDGWFEFDQVGGHKQFKHNEKTGKVTIPEHNKDLKPKTLASILRQAGLK